MNLEATALSVSYGRHEALRHVSISVLAGEFVAVLGANGAGKTTLVNALSGLASVEPESSIEFNGVHVENLAVEKRVLLGLIQVPERRQLFADMTVEENLWVGGSNKRVVSRRRTNLERVYELFPALSNRRRQLAGSLSGGEQQMVAVGRAMMQEPHLLMLDEPSMGLAPLVVNQMFDVLKELSDRGLGVLLIEQNLDLALRYSQRGYVLARGELVAAASSAELIHDDRVREAYLGV